MSGIAIVGAGWLGAAIANVLASAPEPPRVIATTRSGTRPVALHDAIELVTLDVGAPDIAAIADAHAWLVAIAPGGAQDRRALYVDGTAALLSTLPRTRVRRVVWIGSTSALPDRDGDVDEHEPEWPEEERGRIQREAEAVVADACTRAGVPWLVLRMAGLYGPGRELERIYARGLVEPLAGDGMTATNLVHRDDAVAAAIAALEAPAEHTGIVHVVDDDHCPRRTMLEAAAQRLGRAAPRWAEPPGPIRGKRVRSTRLGPWLGVRLAHPTHGRDGR